jgi:hypothetical protein
MLGSCCSCTNREQGRDDKESEALQNSSWQLQEEERGQVGQYKENLKDRSSVRSNTVKALNLRDFCRNKEGYQNQKLFLDPEGQLLNMVHETLKSSGCNSMSVGT